MKHPSIDLIKISQAIDHTYTLLQKHDVATEGIKQIEVAKDVWKQAFTHVLSNTLRV
ncbi:hypothetical protein B0I26_110117 [Anoxybacillus vitaminiphilus]|jgi:hypothetical protein|uniref:Uncharacterized protein n=1 Tax=Paranoxybacillus vitaminiphilus TaxID=581036 RepID=A0A327YF89_9BACL|nr:hypothetical protein [Anoxybacillus vitaminiphilus]RAK18485.1 hypothetical protein B0I26_110117 [Anoxybacillus vitaminiphilus]